MKTSSRCFRLLQREGQHGVKTSMLQLAHLKYLKIAACQKQLKQHTLPDFYGYLTRIVVVRNIFTQILWH